MPDDFWNVLTTDPSVVGTFVIGTILLIVMICLAVWYSLPAGFILP